MRPPGEISMRRSFGLIMTVGDLLTAAPAHAQTFDPRYPVCMHVYSGANAGGGEWYHRPFPSVPLCHATAPARSARCDLNPYYPLNAPPQRLRYQRGG